MLRCTIMNTQETEQPCQPRVSELVAKSNERQAWASLKQIEHRQWWLWGSAAIVTLLLTAGMLSFTYTFLFDKQDSDFVLNLHQAIRGLVGLVFLFDLYTFYQQLQIYRIRCRLIQNEKMFQLICENAEDLVAIVDLNGNRIYNSPSYVKTLGYSLEELKHSPGLEQVHPDDRPRVMQATQEAIAYGSSNRLEYRFRHKDQTWRNLESTASAIRNNKGEAERLVIVNRDITQRKKTEEALRQRDEQLRQSQKMEAVGRLSGGIAHDFNNLMGVILGYSEAVQSRLKPGDPTLTDMEEIKQAGQSAVTLTRQLLAFSRQQVLQPRVLDLNDVVSDIGKMVRRLIGGDIELTTSMEPDLAKVKADKGQIEQVIMNLAVNSRDAMPEGGKFRIETKNVEVEDVLADSLPDLLVGPYVQLIVSDTGTGMSAETQQHIFEPFFTTKAVGKGTGLGLATVYGIVKQSGGAISVTSSPGKGTSFAIYLPRVEASVRIPAVAPARGNTSQGTETILLVEDEDSFRRLISNSLTESGYSVLTAPNGARALEIAESFKGTIHLLLTDVVMPGMNGPALAKNLAALRPDMRILYMSGYASFDDFGGSGAHLPDTISLLKPFSRDILIREVRRALAQAQAQVPAVS